MPPFRRFIQILDAFITDLPATSVDAAAGRADPDSQPAVPARSETTSLASARGAPVEIPLVQVGREFVTPVGQRRLRVLKFAGAGSRAKVYQAVTLDHRETYALKIIHETTPIHLRSLVVETTKAETLARHQLPFVRIIETGITYVLKEWIDGIDGEHWVRQWLDGGADPTDRAFRELICFFRGASAKGVHVQDLKPANMMLRNATEWVPVDTGPIEAGVPPAAAMKCYRERFIRRWLWASRRPFWYLAYQTWRHVRRVDRPLARARLAASSAVRQDSN